jgi:arylsulfatase A-like enzyme
MQNDAPAYHERLPEVVREKSRNARWYFGRTKDYYGNELEYRQDWHIQQDSIYQSFIKNYYALITGIDHTVGRIRHELEKLGMADNTIIIYTSDNGFFTGSKQLMGKALLYEESARAPMILYDPRQPEKEEMVLKPGLISHVDIAPTLLDLAGIAIPESYPGASFMPLVRGDRGMIHEAVFGENNYDGNYPLAPETDDPEEYRSIRSQFVRTAGFKYIRYHENQPVVEELYRINEDPLEAHNLIHDPAYADTVEAMRARIADFERKYVKYKNGEPAEATPGEVDEDTKGRRSPSGK